MLCVETIGKIRRYRLVEGKSIKAISRELRLSRNTVRRVLRERRRASKYERRTQPRPRLGAYVERLEGMLAAEEAKPRAERRRVVALVEELRRAGYGGAHDSVHRYVRAWRRERPVACPPGCRPRKGPGRWDRLRGPRAPRDAGCCPPAVRCRE